MSHRVAILGAGIGGQHVDGYLALGNRFAITHICDLDAERAAGLARRAGARPETDLDKVLADPAVDIVDICLPPMLHVPVALRALEAGKHVIVEKPIAGSLADADRLVAAEAAAPGHVFPVFQYRFGRAFEALANLAAADLLGQPLVATLETHWSRSADYYAVPWRGTWAHELGGAVLSHAIHAHDLLTRFFGPVAAVSAMLTTRANPIETEDCAAIAFQMANGAVANSSITLGAADNTSRMRFVFEHVTAESARVPYAPGAADWTFTARDPDTQQKVSQAVAAGAAAAAPEGFAGAFAAVADALEGSPHRVVGLADGHASIELVSAIYHAHRSGGRVALPLNRALPICQSLAP